MVHQAKKSLGQNFLKSVPALKAMCESGNVGNEDIIIEIGPGKGALTSYLLEKAGKVIAIEKDRDLIEILKEKFKTEIDSKKLLLVNDDILLFNPKDYGLEEGKYKLIANIPYNITGAILKKFLSEIDRPKTIVVLVQKEVAERIVARDNKESILSLSVKVYGTPKYIMKVGKRFFSPSPKVDSAIIAIDDISIKNFKTKEDEERFFNTIKTGFAHKRKVLRKNLEDIDIEKGKEKIDEIFQKLRINPMTRAENVKLPTWIDIAESLYK